MPLISLPKPRTKHKDIIKDFKDKPNFDLFSKNKSINGCNRLVCHICLLKAICIFVGCKFATILSFYYSMIVINYFINANFDGYKTYNLVNLLIFINLVIFIASNFFHAYNLYDDNKTNICPFKVT